MVTNQHTRQSGNFADHTAGLSSPANNGNTKTGIVADPASSGGDVKMTAKPVPRFQATPISDADLQRAQIIITADERAKLPIGDKLFFRAMAVEALKPKFKATNMSTNIQGQTFHDKNYAFRNLATRLRRRLKAYSMDDVFEMVDTTVVSKGVYKFNASDPVFSDLLEQGPFVTLEAVLGSSHVYANYCSSEVTRQNLYWSYDLIMNSCDVGLAESITNRMEGLGKDGRTGPVAYYLLCQTIAHANNQHARQSPNFTGRTGGLRRQPRRKQTR
uniref:Uncharacterized protein n=1 Tax=Craspedostauros australis TaxID=1486917 RepID=A0A7R9WPG4_9STRA|mmetsp:Transcript_12319/g.33858  ORF Transcript_12319/g.33858 Transcript_12319/m.33858 type:complete len:273 (+) Transcript_12319:44-862(+)